MYFHLQQILVIFSNGKICNVVVVCFLVIIKYANICFSHGKSEIKLISKYLTVCVCASLSLCLSLEEVQAPNVLPLVQCGSLTGDITLGCLATGATPASLTLKWTAEGKALPGAVQYPTSKKGNTYTGVSQISVRRQDWDARKTYTCSAGNVDATLQKIGRIHSIMYLFVQLKL